MKKVSDLIADTTSPELIEIDRVFYSKSIFILPEPIWLKYWAGGHGRTPDGKEVEQGIIGFPNGTAIQITMPRETFVEETKVLIGTQIGEAVMTPEDNKNIYISFLRENFKYVGEFIRAAIEGGKLQDANKNN